MSELPLLANPGVLRWKKATASFANGDCVEVAGLPDGQVAVRDSKDPDGPILRFSAAEWRAFLTGIAGHEFDLI
jgi:Domain of unknown function (DUF397)